jgi:hypothetical protein
MIAQEKTDKKPENDNSLKHFLGQNTNSFTNETLFRNSRLGLESNSNESLNLDSKRIVGHEVTNTIFPNSS